MNQGQNHHEYRIYSAHDEDAEVFHTSDQQQSIIQNTGVYLQPWIHDQQTQTKHTYTLIQILPVNQAFKKIY